MTEAKRTVLDLFRSKSQGATGRSDTLDNLTVSDVSNRSMASLTSQQQDKTRHRHQHQHRHSRSPDRPKRSYSRPRFETSSQPSIPSATDEATRDDRGVESPSLASPPQWPPKGLASENEMTLEEATALVKRGVPIYSGSRMSIPNASEDYYALYASCDGGREEDTDTARFYKSVFAAMSFQVQGPGLALHPWDTLEQPSLAFCFGKRPGTITLNHWASLSGHLRQNVALRDSGIRPREVDIEMILDRLIQLESAVEDDEEIMYKNLYKKFLKDPDKFWGPHKAMERQIADLITVLSGPQWIDFSNPRNQIVAKFFAQARYTDQGQSKTFLYQVLLSLELDIRIHSKHHASTPKQKLLSQLPPRIGWDLALARKWRDTIGISDRSKEYSRTDSISFHLKTKRRQIKALRKFAKALNWPNLANVDDVLRSKGRDEKPLEDRSSDSMAYFAGLILPGPTLPWLLMNSLIDCDRDTGGDLSLLTHMYPHCGFQYRTATYWSSTCIVGKVLGPSCREIAGWIGPTRPAPDLQRIQIARIRQRRPRQQITPKEVQSMALRSDPLGPPSSRYPVIEYQQILPDLEEEGQDFVRIEKLALKLVSHSPSGNDTPSDGGPKSIPSLFDACIQFAINGRSWPLRLSFDVSYIYAFPCTAGPHPLFYDYIYKAVKVHEVLAIANWGGLTTENTANVTGSVASSSGQNTEARRDDNDVERVLVVEAFGVSDNEVLARAYCSHWYAFHL